MALIKCPECKKEISDKATQCIHCGSPIEKKIICSECGKETNKNLKICPNCGNKLLVKEKTNNILTKKNIITLSIIIGTIIILSIIILITSKTNKKEKIDLQAIYDNVGCSSYYCKLATDGSYLEIDTNPSDIDDYSSYIARGYVEDINLELGFTEALYTKMGKTRALDGTLTDENENVKVSWTYHPDDGLEVIYYLK